MIIKLFCLLFISLVSLSVSAKVELRQHKAHVHGSAKLDISILQDTIDTTLDIPGIDLMGFEGKAKTETHRKNQKTVTDLLTKDYNMFLLDDAAGCTITKRDLHKEDSKDPDHADYEYKMTYKCKDITKIKELDVNLFRDLEFLKQVTVQLITEKTEKEVKLTPTESKITL